MVAPAPPGLVPPPTRPAIDISWVNNFLMLVGSYAEDWIFGMPPDASLFHYTDLAGLIGILTANDLWLTHSRFSNDEQELTHGYALAHAVVATAREQTTDPARAAYLDLIALFLREPPAQGVYIACFCKMDNLLSQWRGYGANGTGVSIRVQPRLFDRVTGPDSPHGGSMRLWKAFYDPRTQRSLLETAVNMAYDPSLSIEACASHAADAIDFFVPTFKNADFTSEDECRLIFTPPPNCPVKPRFRVGRGMVMPYYSLKELSGGGQTIPIAGVTVGPSPNRAANVESIRMLLAMNGYPNISVEASATPYRG